MMETGNTLHGGKRLVASPKLNYSATPVSTDFLAPRIFEICERGRLLLVTAKNRHFA